MHEQIPAFNPVKFIFDTNTELLNQPYMKPALENILRNTKKEEFSHA